MLETCNLQEGLVNRIILFLFLLHLLCDLQISLDFPVNYNPVILLIINEFIVLMIWFVFLGHYF